MRAVVVSADKRLHFADVAEPTALPSDVIIDVKAISLNRGEVRQTRTFRPEGYRPGWDIAGVVVKEADRAPGAAYGTFGKGPALGSRVVGLLPTAAWAERVAVPANSVAVLPDNVSFAQAATLPVAALTALGCLDKRGANLLGRRVLITGATGGVGHFATQLARLSGAHVVAAVRSETGAEYATRFGAHEVAIVGNEPAQAGKLGPYDLILDSVGGASAGASMNMLAPAGVCVLFGGSSGLDANFNVQSFYFSGGASVFGYVLFRELECGETASIGFKRILPLLSSGALTADIALERPWAEIDAVAEELMNRSYTGKAVLHL